MGTKITDAKQLSVELRNIRRSKKLSQTQISKNVGIRQDTVSKFEQSPESTKLETFFKLLSALELEIEVKPRNANSSHTADSAWSEEW
ncbi:helix-turn-helix domain-containing protein [Parashewanella curva]|uniref:Helix-turn-helix domain-containing protein n=1 Tax=Parashewanella curva TaxID=2338552 RepID=A0A3L8PSA5_9GAMM|nr:helix-turn-helix domain-containing protein [Parashewanella curva]RLV58275.1 helix-turn-helix domain-containing protein [Parashewanella curva]